MYKNKKWSDITEADIRSMNEEDFKEFQDYTARVTFAAEYLVREVLETHYGITESDLKGTDPFAVMYALLSEDRCQGGAS